MGNYIIRCLQVNPAGSGDYSIAGLVAKDPSAITADLRGSRVIGASVSRVWCAGTGGGDTEGQDVCVREEAMGQSRLDKQLKENQLPHGTTCTGQRGVIRTHLQAVVTTGAWLLGQTADTSTLWSGKAYLHSQWRGQRNEKQPIPSL